MDEMEEGMGALKAKLGRILTKPKVFFAGLTLGGVIVAVLFITIFNNGKAAGAKETTHYSRNCQPGTVSGYD